MTVDGYIMENLYKDQSEGIAVEKRIKRYPSRSLIQYYISSERKSPVAVSLLDQVPLTVPREAIQFYSDHGAENWDLYQDNQVLWSGEVNPDESVFTAFEITSPEIDQFNHPPEILSVNEPSTEEQAEELLWRRSSVEPLSKNVLDSESMRSGKGLDDEHLKTVCSVLSHDVGNLLIVIEGQIGLAQETGDDEHLEEALTVLEHLEELIENLITLGETGHQVTELEPVDLETIATQAWYEVSYSEATLEIDQTKTILADESALRQLFDNLFRNAVDHGGSGVTVQVGTLDRGGFYVEDDGDGIPPSQQDQVFEAGYSTDEQSGLGLAIVQRLAENHGWEIDIKNGSEGGARFEFET